MIRWHCALFTLEIIRLMELPKYQADTHCPNAHTMFCVDVRWTYLLICTEWVKMRRINHVLRLTNGKDAEKKSLLTKQYLV